MEHRLRSRDCRTAACVRGTIATLFLVAPLVVSAQPLGTADDGAPGDAIIQSWLAERTARIEAGVDADTSAHDPARTERLRTEYRFMLGLDPLPPRGPTMPTVTGHVEGDGFVVDMLHYESLPGLTVTANLWRPADPEPGTRHPAILYVCGHSGRGRNGNKTAFQDQGMWFARHGYVCLVVDTLQLGEIAATHHGTYQEGRWWWQSLGYTPAGVECWNGIRGIDLLCERGDVDPLRIGVTGISGGGAATLWIAAADERVRVAVPVSGMADLTAYVPDRCINGHCDCMFLVNTFEWPWARIAALVAPRPMLLINSDTDPIFPMDAFERVAATLERVYALHGAGDSLDALVSRGGHAYRADIRAGAYRFLNTHLKDDPRPVTDSEIDLVSDDGAASIHPIEPERLRVFPTDAAIPSDRINTTIDERFVPRGRPEPPRPGDFGPWRSGLLDGLRRVTFRDMHAVPTSPVVERPATGPWRIESEPGLFVDLFPPSAEVLATAKRHRLIVRGDDTPSTTAADTDTALWRLDPRGVGAGRWTRRNPPNHVERSMALLGDTVAAGRVRDTLAAVHAIRAADTDGSAPRPIDLTGSGGAGLVAAYAAIFSPLVDSVELDEAPPTHMAPDAPAFLNILRVADVPTLLGLLAPRRLLIRTSTPERFADTATIYAAAGAPDSLVLRSAD